MCYVCMPVHIAQSRGSQTRLHVRTPWESIENMKISYTEDGRSDLYSHSGNCQHHSQVSISQTFRYMFTKRYALDVHHDTIHDSQTGKYSNVH